MNIPDLIMYFTYLKLLVEFVIDIIYICVPSTRDKLYRYKGAYFISHRLKYFIDEEVINSTSDIVDTLKKYLSLRRVATFYIILMTIDIITALPVGQSTGENADSEIIKDLYYNGV